MSSRADWEARHRSAGVHPLGAPSRWVMARALALPPSSLVLDLACGRGRHAIPLARAGLRVIAVDFARHAVEAACRAARPLGSATLAGVVADLARLPFRGGRADAVLVVNYLDRSLFPGLAALLRPGGLLIVETFTAAQRSLGRGPNSPSHLLDPGELPNLIAPLRTLEYREGLVRDDGGERYVACMAAVNTGGGRREAGA